MTSPMAPPVAWARVWRRAAVALLSAGWLVPMWLGLRIMLAFIGIDVWPLLLDRPRANSFPFVDAAATCFAVGFAWLGLVVAGWAWVASRALEKTPPP